ncbi:type IV secretory system conjugative DNA transfer family protein [Siphonobacter sp. BAB-5385]|uniref:type IV secretory system conjugative DNA transfer family protein n=1 Tax=Siphonobacter sp. BAB-5385 TaxID=1864822 RepID=UPI001595D562|nr:TraM recognition domain-containing protein [Siphonobacter sp. BAB-5385]
MQLTLDQVLYRFNGEYAFTVRQACEGVQIFGGIGSGKTSGSGAALARAYLKAGFGGLVLCAKKDELTTWEGYAKETGRKDSLLVFDGSGNWVFPFLHYETTREGEGSGYTENLVRLFMTVYEAISRRNSNGGSDPYWASAMQQLIRNAVDLCMIATGTVSVPMMYRIVQSAPLNLEQLSNGEWQEKSECFRLLLACNLKKKSGEIDQWQIFDFDACSSYWLEEFPALSPNTRSGIISMFTTTADCLMRRPFRQLFCEVPENEDAIAYPELSQEGIVIILNIPVKEFGDAGRAAQLVYKYMWQQAIERRDINQFPRPVFLWCDEAQNFITDYDMHFQATARSSRACTVYLTQNLPNYFAELGSRDRVNSLVGNLQTKIWHANSDPETNNHASEVIGRRWQIRQGISQSVGGETLNFGNSQSESFDYDCPPQEFSRLLKGGPANENIVEGIVFQNGRVWANNRDLKNAPIFLRTSFKQ